MPPSKYPIDAGAMAFSKRLESSRKDVECFFGIAKGRFRILKFSIPYRKQIDIDNVFFTICILHIMLHSFDNKGEMDAKPNWSGSTGLHNAWEYDPALDHSFVGSKDATEEVEKEAGFKGLKRTLITSFVFRKNGKDIVWLS